MGKTRDYSMSEAVLVQRQQASSKHLVHSFERRGTEALDPQRINRLDELRQMLSDAPGRVALRRELAARMILISEMGFAHLKQQAENGENFWESGVIRRLGSYVAESRRLLDSFEDDTIRGTAADIIIKEMEKLE